MKNFLLALELVTMKRLLIVYGNLELDINYKRKE